MENKSNSLSRVKRMESQENQRILRFSIRKYSFGAASVAVAALMFLGARASVVQADTTVNATEVSLESSAPNSQPATPTLDKSQLEGYIAEIEGKISSGKYANKTEESITLLNSELASAKSVLVSATSQDELKVAYNQLVTVVSSKLKNKPVEKKETPAVDTTNGKETVGKRAENTEPKSGTNSIENTGTNDSRNRQAIPTGIQFRAEVAFSKGTNAEANGHSDTYVLNDVGRRVSRSDAEKVVSRVTNYKVKYNKDANGKITSLDWLVFFNDHSENLANTYQTDGGEIYRNYIQIPAEVEMPTSITRAQYASPRNLKWINGKPQRIKPNGTPVSASSTFDNPTPESASGLPRVQLDTINIDKWPNTNSGRDLENLSLNLKRYFGTAGTDESLEIRETLREASVDGKRVFSDRSTTGGSSYNSYVWSFRTKVPETTTNEDLKNMKVVFGMMRSATAGANAAFANVASNPVKLWQSDI
ncbi:YSIRK-type signal peptide-containing protein, partial [Streptococcus sp. 27098_8_76]|uniref:YSIRK-type signal peptide-containing protein n=1 Tax=Streptococcus sp. 27098_8_76 TaxID=3003658 RepID=UPI00352E811C